MFEVGVRQSFKKAFQEIDIKCSRKLARAVVNSERLGAEKIKIFHYFRHGLLTRNWHHLIESSFHPEELAEILCQS